MKKRLIAVFVAVLMIAGLAACSAYPSIKVEGAQDTGYAVTSNGGMAVAYGNYVYFVNGYKSPDDSDGKTNKWGEVIQGGIFRAELLPKDASNPDKTGADKIYPAGVKEFNVNTAEEVSFSVTKDVKNPYYFFNSKDEAVNDNDELIETDTEEQPFKIDTVNVTQIVSKNITADSEGKGGLYIFDNYIYYASRNNQKDKNGNIQSHLYDFYRTKLNGTGTQKLYTTSSGDNIKYRFYNTVDGIYLVVLEGTNLVSVKIAKKAEKRLIIAEDVTGAILPEVSTYYKDINTNGGSWQYSINDFIYFTRAATKEDNPKSGIIVEMIHPNGIFREEVTSNPTELTFNSVRSDSLYYTETRETGTALIRREIKNITVAAKRDDCSVLFKEEEIFASSSGYSQMMPFRNISSNNIYDAFNSALYVSGSKLMLHTDTMESRIILNEAVTIITVIGDYIYFNKGDNNLYRTTLETAEVKMARDGAEYQKISDRSILGETFFMPDVAAGQLFYNVASLYDWAPNYTMVKRVTLKVGEKEIFIGKIEQENPNIEIHKEHEEDEDALCQE